MCGESLSETAQAAEEEVLLTAVRCLKESSGERPELRWLKNIYEQRRRECGLSKMQMDVFLYERMTGAAPHRASDTLKLRYWRTGQHEPANRQIALSFAQGLSLSEEERAYYLTAWLDRSLYYYEQEPPQADASYWERRQALQRLAQDYARRRMPDAAHITRSGLRHLYYMDALQYVNREPLPNLWGKKINSLNYDAEWKRHLRLLGEIPRAAMLRHLILLTLPKLSVEGLNERLSFFGYLPLTPEHTLSGGERLDSLLLALLGAYQELLAAEGADRAQRWFIHCYRRLDDFFTKARKPAFRFMYFRALG